MNNLIKKDTSINKCQWRRMILQAESQEYARRNMKIMYDLPETEKLPFTIWLWVKITKLICLFNNL